jgi:hypothetical protein
MAAIYFHLRRFLANQHANRQIRLVVKGNSTEFLKFRYSQGFLSTKIKLVDVTSADLVMIDETTDRITSDISRILAERQSTLDQLHRERYGTEDAL